MNRRACVLINPSCSCYPLRTRPACIAVAPATRLDSPNSSEVQSREVSPTVGYGRGYAWRRPRSPLAPSGGSDSAAERPSAQPAAVGGNTPNRSSERSRHASARGSGRPSVRHPAGVRRWSGSCYSDTILGHLRNPAWTGRWRRDVIRSGGGAAEYRRWSWRRLPGDPRSAPVVVRHPPRQ